MNKTELKETIDNILLTADIASEQDIVQAIFNAFCYSYCQRVVNSKHSIPEFAKIVYKKKSYKLLEDYIKKKILKKKKQQKFNTSNIGK